MNRTKRRRLIGCVAVWTAWLASAPAQCVDGSCAVGGPSAMVRVVHSLRPCRSYGSGTIIADDGRRAIVLSCAHLFREGSGRVLVRLSDGREIEAELLETDFTWDLAVLAMKSLGIAPVRVSTVAPKPGDALRSCGFGSSGVYWCNAGTARGYAKSGAATTHETLVLTGRARDGDSGGPVLNQAGELVGVLWGTDGRTVHATYCGRVRKFLARVLPARPPAGEEARRTPPEPIVQPPAIVPPLPKPREDEPPQDDRPLDRELPDTSTDKPTVENGESKPVDVFDMALAMATGAAPYVLAALGITVPPAGAMALGLWAARRLIRRRRGGRRHVGNATSQDELRAAQPLNDRYAEQLNGVYALSGRSPTADATLGREYDRELCELETGSDDAVARWAGALRRRVADRFLRIHDASPLPAEPLEDSR